MRTPRRVLPTLVTIVATAASLMTSARNVHGLSSLEFDRISRFVPRPYALSLTPDGEFLLSNSVIDYEWAIWDRDPVSGELALVEHQPFGRSSGSTKPAAVSPTGDHVYVPCNSGDSVDVFALDGATGALTAIESVDSNPADVVSAQAVVVSPDGAHVYVAAGPDDGIAVYARNPTTGELSFVEAQEEGVGGVSGIDYPRDVAIDPSGAHVYVTGWLSDAVVAFERDVGTGALTFVGALVHGIGGVDGLERPGEVEVSSDGAHVYVASAIGGAISVFERDAGTGALTFVEAVIDGVSGVDGIDGCTALALSPDGAHLYAAGPGDSAVTTFARDGVTGELTFVEMDVDDVAGVDGMDSPVSVAISSDGAHVYVADAAGTDQGIAVFSRDGGTGALTFVGASSDGVTQTLTTLLPSQFTLPSDLTFRPDGEYAYATSPGDALIGAFRRMPTKDGLTMVELTIEGVGGVTGLTGVAQVATSPDDAHVYAVAAGANALTAFASDAWTGRLAFIEVETDGVAGVDGLDGATGIAISPDGTSLYVAGSADDAVAAFSRDPGTGEVAFVHALFDGVGGIDGLAGARGVAVSSDGANVYVTGSADSAVAVFVRDLGTGALTFAEAHVDGVGGVEGLAGARGIALSPDGASVYVGGELDDAIAVFSRDAGTGALTFLEVHQEGVAGVFGLDGVVDLTVTDDGTTLYAASESSDRMASFRRESPSGRLYYAELHSFTLYGARAVTAAPDGRVHVTGDRMVELTPDHPGCAATPLAGCATAPKAKLRISDSLIDKKDRFFWKWERGNSLFPDHPDMAVCLYDESGIPTLVGEIFVPGANAEGACTPSVEPFPEVSCWKNESKYKDKFGTPSGVIKLTTRESQEGKASIKLTAKGAALEPPTLPLGLPVRVQARTGSGTCWETVFAAPKKNDAATFKASE